MCYVTKTDSEGLERTGKPGNALQTSLPYFGVKLSSV